MKYTCPLLMVIVMISMTTRSIAQQFDVTANGAIGDGKTLATKAIQATIDLCHAHGGGTVYVPAGTFRCGTVSLKSNVHLYLETGAVIMGSERLEDYREYDMPGFGKNYFGLFYTDSASNVAITGHGTIEGNNAVFFDWTKAKKIEWGGTKYTRQQDRFRKVENGVGDGPVVPLSRPHQLLIFSRCSNVLVADVQLLHAPFWTLHFADCDKVNVTGISLVTNMLVPNADGIDVTSCSNVIIADCDIRAGDDAIAITGYDHHFEIPGFHGLRHASENILISNCNLQSFSSAIRIGFLDQNTVRNIHVNNVNITNSTRGIGIFVRDEGSLENISFSNMYIQTVLHTGDWWGNGEPIHISAVRGKDSVKLGAIRKVQFSNIICKGENGILLYGSAESMLEDISFDHVRFEVTESPINATSGGNVDLRGCSLEQQLFARDIPAILASYVHGLSLEDVQVRWTGITSAFFTHGIELDHFTGVSIRKFNGEASPANKKAFRIHASSGKGLELDDQRNTLRKNVY